MMSFQSRARGPRPRQRPTGTDAAASDTAPTPPNVAEGHERAANDNLPGWHASSMDLRDGLEVTEHASLDSLPPDWADSLPD